MPLHRRFPPYTLHKPTGQARVRIDGRDHYLGTHGSPESRARYDRLIAEWLASGRVGPDRTGSPPDPDGGAGATPGLTVDEILSAYWRHCEDYYRLGDGSPSRELDCIRDALKPLRRLYGRTPAQAFGPKALRAVRDEAIRAGLARTTVNGRVHRIRRAFRWAASVELLPVSVIQALDTVEGLRRGRSAAREPEPVRPVPDDQVEAVLPHLAPVVAAMIRLQRITGMRPAEVVAMRPVDLDTSDPNCWAYRPTRHKTEHHGRERIIFLGPRSIALIRPWLGPDVDTYLFSPRRSEAERHRERRLARTTPLTPSQRARRRLARPGRSPGECYSVASYRRAIRRACEAAGVPAWSPHQLRHSAATEIRRRFGLEATQVVLGHAELGVTQVYAERDLARAREVMRAIG